jgi:hypothetical protein
MAVCKTDSPRELQLGSHVVRCHAVEQELERHGPAPEKLSQAIRERMAAESKTGTAAATAV